jgi:molybdopterin/thiamine biosynthesis adenylyltransferase
MVEARERLADALARAGFHLDTSVEDEPWWGVLTFTPASGGPARSTVVTVSLPDGFPFAPVKVHPQTRAQAEGLSGRAASPDYYEASPGWHRDRDLAMCLFDEVDQARLAWADGAALLDQVQAWLAADASGWPSDAPALDLQRYLRPSREHRLILYGQLDHVDEAVLRLRPERHNILRVGQVPSPARAGSSTRRKRWGPRSVLVLHAGELAAPIRDWQDLCAAVGPARAQTLVRARADDISRVLVRYSRQDVPAVLAVELQDRPGRPDEAPLVRALRSAPDDLATRTIRAGKYAASLAETTVAIVGVGAVGSVVADLLHRSGVGHLHFIDPDVVLPGNTTRHLLGQAAVGLPKPHAVAQALRVARPTFGRITTNVAPIDTPQAAVQILAAVDLVVDATAESTATALLTAAARSGAGRLLSAYVLADGYAVRVDRTAGASAGPHLPALHLPSPGPDTYEAGCGSPVSTTPPAAVWEAAAMAVRHAIDMLQSTVRATDARSAQTPQGTFDAAGEERVLRARPT